MSIIQKIRQKTPTEKMRIIWAATAAVAILLVIIWVISARYYKNVPKDKTFFQTISNGIKDVRDNFKK